MYMKTTLSMLLFMLREFIHITMLQMVYGVQTAFREGKTVIFDIFINMVSLCIF